MSVTHLIAALKAQNICLSANGEKLRVEGPTALLTDELRIQLAKYKSELMALLAPKPRGCAWREDERGRLIYSDGTIYSPTATGGWILVRHPTHRMVAPGTFAVDGGHQ